MIEIIPAIDIIDGQCVRLSMGDYETKKVYDADPLKIAKGFEAKGIKKLHLVDLDGAKASHIINHEVLNQIASETQLEIDFGGGIKSEEDARTALASGANQINIGSLAVTNPELLKKWIENYGAEKIILGADVKNEMIAIHGWKETSSLSLWDFLEDYVNAGIQYVVCTDVSKDGMLQGPSFDLYGKIQTRFPEIKLVASGGVSRIEDVLKLNEMGIYGAIIGKAIYEGKIDLDELMNQLNYAD